MTDEQQHRLEVILEDMNGKFDLLLEGHATLDRKIDLNQAEAMEKHGEAIAMIRTVHDSLDDKIDSVRDELKAEIRSVGERVDGHEARIHGLEKKVA